MKKLKNKFVAVALSMATVLSSIPASTVYADSQRIITLGSDLSEEQKDTVLAFFGVSEDNLEGIEVLTITNQDEHALLDSVMSSSVIGNKTYSCAYIEPTTSGGIYIRTANLTYVTNTSLYNALQTAGIENCNLLVTAPFDVSGTGALTGVFKAFESTGNALDKDKQEIAAEELIIDAELESTYGEESANMVSDIKEEIVSSKEDLSEEEIELVISDTSKKYEITLSTEDVERLVSLMGKLQTLEYDVDAFSEKITDIMKDVEGKAKEAEGLWGKIVGFFESIVNFFKGLFSKETTDGLNSSSIFDNINTDIFDYDDVSKDDLEDNKEVVSPTVTEESKKTEEVITATDTPVTGGDISSSNEEKPNGDTQLQEETYSSEYEGTSTDSESPISKEETVSYEGSSESVSSTTQVGQEEEISIPTPTPTPIGGIKDAVFNDDKVSDKPSNKIPEGVETPLPTM